MAVEERKGFHWAWVILATVFVDLFINYSVRIGYGVVMPEMISNLGFSRTGVSSIYNSYLFAYLAITPFSGYLTDRLGARRVIATCALILGIGVILMGTINTLWTACLSTRLWGLEPQGCGPLCLLWFNDGSPQRNAGLLLVSFLPDTGSGLRLWVRRSLGLYITTRGVMPGTFWEPRLWPWFSAMLFFSEAILKVPDIALGEKRKNLPTPWMQLKRRPKRYYYPQSSRILTSGSSVSPISPPHIAFMGSPLSWWITLKPVGDSY